MHITKIDLLRWYYILDTKYLKFVENKKFHLEKKLLILLSPIQKDQIKGPKGLPEGKILVIDTISQNKL